MQKTLFIVLLSVVTLCSCTPTPPRDTTSIQQIQQLLEQGIADNQRIDRRAKHILPGAVNRALVPDMSDTRGGSRQAKETQRRFDVAVKDSQANVFFMGLVEDTPYSMVVSPDVKGTISLNLKNVTISEVMNTVRDVYGYEFRETHNGYEVLPNHLVSRTFVVNYLDVLRHGETTTTTASGQISEQVSGFKSGAQNGQSIVAQREKSRASGTDVSTITEIDFWKDLSRTLWVMVGKDQGRFVVVNPTVGLIVVRAYPQELRIVADYLDQLQQHALRQVILEAKIFEVELKEGYQAGIDWSMFTGGKEGRHGVTQMGRSKSFPNTNIIAPFTNIFALDIKTGDFTTIIDLLSRQGNVQILSSPRITAMNNQKAVIKVGRDEFFVTGISTSTTISGSSTIPNEDIELTPFFSGINLDVIPQISGNGEVILHIHPAVSEVVDQVKKITVSDREFDLPLALSDIRESDTIVRAKSGQIVVIGGLMQNKTIEDVVQTPILGDIPFLGALFRHTKQRSVKSELVILLRPIVVENKTWTRRLERAKRRFTTLDRGFHVGGKAHVFGTEGETFDLKY